MDVKKKVTQNHTGLIIIIISKIIIILISIFFGISAVFSFAGFIDDY